jgi:hypothetical protein
MEKNQAIDMAIQEQLMKYAEDLAKLYHELKKERELPSEDRSKESKICLESVTKK